MSNKKYHVNENYFEKIDTEEKAYWLGFLYADGNVRMHKGRSGILKLKLKLSDKKHIKKFETCLKSNYPIKDGIEVVKVKNKTYYCYCSTLVIYNTKLVKDLYNLGCINNKTQKIRLPILKNYMNHFIRGYFDGDGCVSKNKNGYYNISITSNANFISDIKEYLYENFKYDLSIYNKKNYSILNIPAKNKIKFYYFIYNNSTIYLERKKEIFDSLINLPDNKKFKITQPDGNSFLINNLALFCRENNLNYSNIYNIVNNLVENYKGWKCEKC